MSTDNNKILFHFEGQEIKSYSNFISEIDSALLVLKKSKRKSIIICTIELIQNALKYRCCGNVSLTISKGENIEVNVYNNSDLQQSEKLKRHFDRIEKTGIAKLKEMSRQNLDSPAITGQSGAGNGLIKCILKSEKRMQLLINNINGSKNQINFKINFEYE